MSGQSTVLAPIERLLDRLNADAAFGTPARRGDTTVIPVAEVEVDLGYGHNVGVDIGPIIVQIQRLNIGGGSGVSAGTRKPGDPGEAAESPPAPGSGESTGGAVRGQVTPRGYVQLTPEGARFEPMIEITRLGLAGVAFSAWSVFWITWAIRAAARAAGRQGR